MDSFSHLSPFFFLHDDKTSETLGSKNFHSTVKETEWGIWSHGQKETALPPAKGPCTGPQDMELGDPIGFSDL